jgi:MoaA/NifB/PqqE/SkfB family radical SAM enzyme
MNKIIKFLNETDFDKMLEDVDYPQNLRCKINTGYVCNSNCLFCYFHSKRDSCNYPIEVVKRQLEIAKNVGVKSVDFSGGEPTIHPEFTDMIKYAKKLGFENICCITNGSTFNSLAYMEECIESGLNDILFSLHGTMYLHDFVTRVEGSFKRLIDGIINSNLCGIKPRVNTVIIKNNYRNLKLMAKVLNDLKISQWNMIIYKMQYECGDPTVDNFVSHEQSAPIIKRAIDVAKKHIKSINVRYIPFCFMEEYEKYVTNYPQKKYDPFEWSNYLLREFEQGEDHIMKMCEDINDLRSLNNNSVKENRQQYKKPFKCGICKHFLICDGFENGYAQVIDINEEANYTKGEVIKNPLYYRKDYGT